MYVIAGVAGVPTTYPVGGYVNMNQLAHMALQHQGLCPDTDKKQQQQQQQHEDVASHPQLSQPVGYREDLVGAVGYPAANQWEGVGGPQAGSPANQHLVDNSGIGMLRQRNFFGFSVFVICILS